MSKRDWGNGLAFGLIVGIALTVFLCIWLSGVGDPIKEPSEAPNASQKTEEQRGQEYYPFPWWHHDGAFVSSKDTLAQWAMAFLGVIATGLSGWAVVLLKRTLRETIKANENGAAGVRAAAVAASVAIEDRRPWLDLTVKPDGDFRTEGSGVSLSVSIAVRNIGHSPAVVLGIVPCYYDGSNYRDDAVKTYADESMSTLHRPYSPHTVFPGAEHKLRLGFLGECSALTPILWMMGEERVIAVGVTVIYASRLASAPHMTHKAYSIIAGPHAMFIPNNTQFAAGNWHLSEANHPTYAD